jgi:GAF domain-containing protein
MIEKNSLRVQNLLNTRLPISALIRWAILVGVIFRVYIGKNDYTRNYLITWAVILLAASIYSLLITVLQWTRKELRNNNRWFVIQVVTDAAIFTFFYLLTKRPNSDFYLFYFLPLLIAAEHLRSREIIFIFLYVSVLFLAALISLNLITPTGLSTISILITNGLPRWFFFLLVFFVVFMRDSLLREKTEELEAVQKTAVLIAKDELLDSRLDAILQAVIGLLNVKGCKVYLKDPEQNRLRLVAIKGLGSEKYSLGYELPLDKGIANKVLLDGKPIIENDYHKSPDRVVELESEYNAIMEVPLLFEVPIGVIIAYDNSKHRKFKQRDVYVLERLAQYAAIAIHDSMLVRQSRKQAEAFKTLYLANESFINASLDLDDTITSIVHYAWKLTVVFTDIPPVSTYFAMLDENKLSLEFKATYPTEHIHKLKECINRIDLYGDSIGITGRAILSETNQNIPDVSLNSDYLEYNSETHSQIAILARGKRGIVGVLGIEHSNLNAFPLELQKQMEVLAGQAASAIENAKLFEQIETRHKQAEILRQATIKISFTSNIDKVGKKILVSLRDLIPFDRATLQLVEGDRREIIATYNLDKEKIDINLVKPISEDALIQQIVESKSIFFLHSTKDAENWKPFPTTEDIKSWVCIPLFYSDKLICLITIDNMDEKKYDSDQENIINLFTYHAASALQNSILLEKLSEQVEQLTQTKSHLEELLRYFEDHRNLALIGLVYGESIHYAKNELGMAKTLAKNIQLGEYRNDVKTLAAKAESIANYITDYLAVLNKIHEKAVEEPSILPVDIHITLDKIISSKRRSREIKIIKEYGAKNSVIYAPERQLRQVFYVIIQNAIDAMSEGIGNLTIKSESRKYNDRQYLVIAISDTGVGINEKARDHLFDVKPTNKGSKSGKGSGMGLVWARSFVRSYGGDITFKTVVDKGTTMFIKIPRDFRQPTILKRPLG